VERRLLYSVSERWVVTADAPRLLQAACPVCCPLVSSFIATTSYSLFVSMF